MTQPRSGALIGAPGSAPTLFSNEIQLFGGLLLAWLLGFDWFLIDRYGILSALPPGVPSVLLECLLEASIIATLFRGRGTHAKEYRYFLWFFCFLLPADIAYLSLHYWLRINEESWLTFALTTLPYSAAYIVGSIGFYKHIKPRLANMRWLSFIWLPILLIVPAILGILLPLLAAHQQASGWSFDLFEIAFNSIFAVGFFFCATVTLLLSLDVIFPLVGLAGIISQLGNWGGVSAYLLRQNTFTFGEYEYLWLCGIITFWYALVIAGRLAPKSPSPSSGEAALVPQADAAPTRSLVIQERMTVIALVSASLICAVLLSRRDIWSYRIVFFGIAIGSFIALLIGELLSKQIIHYATLFGKVVNLTAKEEALPPQESEIPSELWQVYRMVFQEEAVQHRMKAAVRQNLAEQASQVAHDIRSPLVALDSFIMDASQLPEDKRLAVRGAVGRIRDIANSLLDKHRGTAAQPAGEEPAAACLLSSLIEPLITEKRLQYRARIGVEIDARMGESSYGLFAKVQPTEFKRAVSNLINNAVEALPGPQGGLVLIDLAAAGDWISIRVQDNGKGISPELLVNLGQRGESHGKADGSGLGLYHAKSRAEAWGGQLEITSKVGVGTTVTMSLPQALAPEWFVSELRLNPGEAVVILDDDASIHQVWRGRLDTIREGRAIEVVHCSTPVEIRHWVGDRPEGALKAIFLIDHELLGYTETGLSLVEELGIGERTILVTSRFEEPEILKGCRKVGARMIPKGLAGLVPVRLGQPPAERWDAVFIDNEFLARLNWKHAAAKAGKKLRIFSSASEFFKEAPHIDRQSTIYVDQELGEGMKGDQAAARMSELGFTDIYLATGHELPPQPGHKHLKGVVGKEPPWAREKVAG